MAATIPFYKCVVCGEGYVFPEPTPQADEHIARCPCCSSFVDRRKARVRGNIPADGGHLKIARPVLKSDALATPAAPAPQPSAVSQPCAPQPAVEQTRRPEPPVQKPQKPAALPQADPVVKPAVSLPKAEARQRASSIDCPPMMEAAHLSLYRQNTFRITGLPVDATEKQIKRRADELKMMEELGQSTGANRAAFALDPPPSTDEIRQAMQRLKEPEHRLTDEFFWFWPSKYGSSGEDAAMRALGEGDSAAALKIWETLETDPEIGFIASHNIAVMSHMAALDWTLYHLAEDVDAGRAGKIEKLWQESFRRWEVLVDDDRVWDFVKERIRNADEARLSSGFGRRMRDALPEALDKINAEAALEFAELGMMEWAKAHIGYMKQTHQGLDNVEKTAELVLAPTRNRILQHIRTATDETAADPKKGRQMVEKLLDHCEPLQGLFELFHGQKAHQKVELFGDVALTSVNCLVSYQRETDDNAAFVSLLQRTLALAMPPDLRARIELNIQIGKENIESERYAPILAQFERVQDSHGSGRAKLLQVKKLLVELLAVAEQEGLASPAYKRPASMAFTTVRNIGIAAFTQEDDVRTCNEAIDLAQRLASSKEEKERIAEDIAIAKSQQSGRQFSLKDIKATRGVAVMGLCTFAGAVFGVWSSSDGLILGTTLGGVVGAVVGAIMEYAERT